MNIPTLKAPLAKLAAFLFAALAVFVNTGQAQVTLNQLTNGLVSYYPLDFVVTNGSTITTFDYVGARDMIMVNMNSSKVIASTRPSQNSASVSNAFNFDQGGNGSVVTIMYYDSKGQTPLTGAGDFLPFCNQVNATMSFWIKANVEVTNAQWNDRRFVGECDDGSAAGTSPIWLWGTRSLEGRRAHFLFRNNTGNGTFENYSFTPQTLVDGSRQVPDFNGFWQQGNSWTRGQILDQSWHHVAFSMDTNRVVDIYVDGVRDLGPTNVDGTPRYIDIYTNNAYGFALPLTNLYYTTNIFPSAGVSNPPPNGYVRWMWNGIFSKGVTAYGGFRRQGGNTGGFPMYIDDIAYWNRTLSSNEVEFLYTNGVHSIPLVRPLQINSFTADFPEIGKGSTVTLRWNVTGANTISGGIVISGVGDVSTKGLIGSTNVTLNGDQTFTLTIANGIAPNTNASLSVKTFAGVDSGWHLVERFDGVYSDTIDHPLGGLTANNWISAGGDFSGSFDKWNVLTITNSGAGNKVLGPRTGYIEDITYPSGYRTRGALSYAKLGSLTMAPAKTNTLFFRFSLQEPPPSGAFLSDIDFGVGITDYNFLGPSAGLGYYGGTGGGLGPYMSIIRNTAGAFTGGPFNLFAHDVDEATDATTNTFNYTTLDANGLATNANYMVWMDIENYNTHSVTNVGVGSNTVAQAQFSVWLQKQGDTNRTKLFTNFHGNRNYILFNPVNDLPTPNLDKVFFNIGSQDLLGTAPGGAYFATNMIVIDDVYISKSGVRGTVPRLFDITSIVRNPSSVTINWNSLGSLFQTNTYSIQRKLVITDPWSTIASGVPSGGATTTYTDNTVSGVSAYYQSAWP